MKIEIRKFGEILTSRPSGREAFLAARAYLRPAKEGEFLELDFTGVKVMGPSWADEFVSGLKSEFGNRVRYLPSNNPSVIESLKIIS